MTQFLKQHYDNIDITKSEIKDIKEAFKSEKFCNLFSEYVEEVNDPKNKAIFEKEVIQLEKERGVDITFIHPRPGYVIKTSCDGEEKAFINICCNENIGKPSSNIAYKDGTTGRDWSVPYIQAPPRIDVDKNRRRCIIFDVVFHPDALRFAKSNSQFREFINDTALTAVEDSFKTKLDRKNITFPKSQFKGPKLPTVIRKKIEDMPSTSEEPLDIPHYPFKPLNKNITPVFRTPRPNSEECEKITYTTPKYIIKHRKGYEIHEFTYSKDSKINATVPSELVIEIDVPLLRSAGDSTLDVGEKSLSLKSEKPAKYKLDIKLPYSVNENDGSAKFDKSTKKLIVTLPVLQKKDSTFLNRDDSGIESDPNQNRSSDEEVCDLVEVISSSDMNPNDNVRTCEEIVKEFLSPDIHYTFPSYTLSAENNSINILVSVKNIDPGTVAHQYVFENSGIHIKFTSLGSGFFPINYAYCVQFRNCEIDTNTLKVEVWDNNLILHFELDICSVPTVRTYFCGPTTDSLQETPLLNPVLFQSRSKKLEEVFENEKLVTSEKKSDCRKQEIPNESDSINSSTEEPSGFTVKYNTEEEAANDTLPKLYQNKETKKDIFTDDSLTKLCPEISAHLTIDGIKQNDKKRLKTRTCSESNLQPDPSCSNRKSILKKSRSLSESNTDDYTTWSSLDSSDNADETLKPKKTVRFSNFVSKKVFRTNSSILSKDNRSEKKRNRRKATPRRRRPFESTPGVVPSEPSDVSDQSEVSEHSEVSDTSEVSSDDAGVPLVTLSSGKKHRRRGSKNGRKNAATAKQNNFLLQTD